MATSPFSKELRDEEIQSGFEASDADETFELERIDAPLARLRQEASAAPQETLPIPEEIHLPSAETPPAEAIDTIDRELLAMLEAELAAAQKKPAPVQPAPPPPPPAPFVEFDDVEQADAFDFNEIEAQHPSGYIEEQPVEPQPSEPTGSYTGYADMGAKAYSQSPFEPEEQQKTKKPKRNRKVMYLAAAGIVLALGAGSAVYTLWPTIAQMAGLSGGKDTTAHSQPETKPSIAAHTEEKPHAEQQHPPDATAHDAAAHHEENVVAAQKVAPVTHSAVQPKTESETAHPQKESKPAAEAIANEKVQKQAPVIAKHVEKTAHTPPKKVAAEHTENVVAEVRPEIEPKKIPVKQEHTPPKARETVAVEKNFVKQKGKPEKAITKTASDMESGNQVYTVQVYSTPSKDDAEEWLDQLRSKQIAGGFVSNQTVRGQTWYRVRFGAYSSREEAESAARRNGFSKSWIDRVK